MVPSPMTPNSNGRAEQRLERRVARRSVYSSKGPMPLSVDDIVAIGRTVAAEFGDTIDVVGVTSNQVDAGRIELLLNIEGRDEQFRVLLNLARTNRPAFERALRTKLQQALQAHHRRSSSPRPGSPGPCEA